MFLLDIIWSLDLLLGGPEGRRREGGREGGWEGGEVGGWEGEKVGGGGGVGGEGGGGDGAGGGDGIEEGQRWEAGMVGGSVMKHNNTRIMMSQDEIFLLHNYGRMW